MKEEIKEDEAKQPTSKFKTPLLALALLLIVGLGSAALLTVYATITDDTTVNQSVVADGETIVVATIAGNTYTSEINVTNRANVSVPIEFETTCEADNGTATWDCVADTSVTTKYFGKLALSSKDSNWTTTDDMNATLAFELSNNQFVYELDAEGLTASTEYALIYYADKPDRFVNWGGNNPGKLVMTATTYSDGTLSTSGSANLAMDLPTSPDANMEEYDYCDSDNYMLCHGAKLWLVPSADYNTGTKTVNWNPSAFLFETDLITYDDANNGGSAGLYLGTGSITVYVEHTLNVAAAPGTYTITSKVKPPVLGP